jgi:L-ascorbate metabolism protein UlaG (beta-lactamase superfamily)
MKTNRRKFITALTGAVLFPGTLLAKEEREKRSRWDMIFSNHDVLPAPLRPTPENWANDTITAAWIGHSTILINFYGTMIITDPVLSERIGVNILGLFTAGPKRLIRPALTFEQLPKIDLILLSHAHMDHLDLLTLKKFDDSIPVVMAKNTMDVVDGLGWQNVREIDWGEKTTIGDIEINAFRVKHFGWRYPWEEDRSRGNWEGRSYNAYLITKNEKHIFFGGDTAMQDFFKPIKERGISIELAMLPIGSYDPWIFNHANPEQAVSMAHDLNAKVILPMHWSTFIQSDEPTEEPIQRLRKAAGDLPIAVETVGQTWTLEEALASEK